MALVLVAVRMESRADDARLLVHERLQLRGRVYASAAPWASHAPRRAGAGAPQNQGAHGAPGGN